MTGLARREQILDIAQSIAVAEGFHAVTPARVASESGITRPVIYQQFGDISRLLIALIEREALRGSAQFLGAVAKIAKPPNSNPFAQVFEGALEAIDTNPSTWKLFLVPPQGAPPELHERLAEAEAAVLHFLEVELIKAYPAMPDPEYSARALFAAGRELLRLRLVDPGSATKERLAALVRSLTSTQRPSAPTPAS